MRNRRKNYTTSKYRTKDQELRIKEIKKTCIPSRRYLARYFAKYLKLFRTPIVRK